MSLDLNVSTLKNTVTFVVDKNSIAQAKKAADDLHKYFQKIQDPKIRFQQQKQRRQKARQIADDARFNDKPRNAAERAEARKKLREEKANLRAQQQLQRRQETAELKQRHANLQISGIKGKYGLDPKLQYEALKFVQKQTEAFAQGNITSQRMNASIRERITLLRREAAAAQRATQAQGGAYVQAAKKSKAAHGDKEYGIARLQSAAMGFGSMFAAGNLAARIQQTGNENLELIRMSERTKLNPNAVKAIVAWGQQHGVDSASVDKITDGFGKDTREKISETLMNSKFDQKSGQWKGGNTNIEEILNKFGWNKSQLSQYENNPLDFLQATVNEGQRRGYSDGEIAHLLENIFDDGAHYVDLFKNNGEQFISTLKKLVDSGQTLNDEQIKQVMEYGSLSTKMTALTNSLDLNLFTGFMDGFGASGDELTENTKNLNESAHLLGEGLGNLATQVAGATVQISRSVEAINQYLRDKFPSWFSDNNQPAAQQLYNGAVGGSADTVAAWIKSNTGIDTQSFGPAVMDFLGMGRGDASAGTAANNYGLSGQSLRDGAMALPSTPAMSYQVNPVFNLTVAPEVPLTLVSDASRLSDYIDFQARASARSFEQSLTLQINSGQSTAGG
ncbi:TPA: hypothetical protein MJA43_10615 [Klebsiella pneumoniae]|uniref:hypothetical protein n=1 Tax=Klebsiella pneumoniae TaxID=573 RepID=UPI000448D634|nr:hypothetical protein [Klebsiella pneumoniae]EWD73944.1 hypothetical protein P823_04312 [Klebsiella pneumoniae UCI 20]HBY9616452.1 hypothetical protein [Klebsiella pneumoniae]